MGRQQRIERAAMGGDPHKTEIVRLMREFSHSHDPYSVFSDFVEISAIAISSRVDRAQFDAREKRYLEIVGKYKPEEAQRFAAMFAELQMCYLTRIDALGDPGPAAFLDHGLGDVLGELFMSLELGNSRAGQFFTPYSVSQLMAMLTIGDGTLVREHGFITLQEPACGSAGMVVATAQAIHQAGFNYPEALHATCVDIDPRCVHMAYVQLSLLGIAAVVVHGNALSLDVWNVWYTPAHVIVGWGPKLRQRRSTEAMLSLLRTDNGGSTGPASVSVDKGIDVSPDAAEPPAAVSILSRDVAAAAEDCDVAVLPEIARGKLEVQPEVEPGLSIADLFEQLTDGAGQRQAEHTIFDRIGQMALF